MEASTIMPNLRPAIEATTSVVQEFRAAMSQVDGRRITEALLEELRCAKRPNGKTLQALIERQGIYVSQKQNRRYNLLENFISTQGSDGQSISSGLLSLERAVHGLGAVEGLPLDFQRTVQRRVQNVRQDINAVSTPGGLVQELMQRALLWQGGKGATDTAIARAQEVLSGSNGTDRKIQEIGERLADSADRMLRWVEEQGARHFEAGRDHIQPPEEANICIICLDAPADCRAEFVACECAPRVPYACRDCVRAVEVNLRKCPMCRATLGGG
jgi:hypothetical protein